MSFFSSRATRTSIAQLVAATTFASPARSSRTNNNTAHLSDAQALERLDALTSPTYDFEDHFAEDLQLVFEAVYDALRGDNESLSRDAFRDFLTNTQQMTDIPAMDRDEYDFREFLQFWTYNGFWNAVAMLPPKDLSRPLTNYFINSSHNTYLDGNQWSSTSSPDSYTNALRRGCRCIEIDVWNGVASISSSPSHSPHRTPNIRHAKRASVSSFVSAATQAVSDTRDAALSFLRNRSSSSSRVSQAPTLSPVSTLHLSPHTSMGTESCPPSQASVSTSCLPSTTEMNRKPRASAVVEPIVTHGHTWTQPCGFRQVCEAVRDAAFVNNPLPIIVSLEVHADHEQQQVMVDIMREVWKGLLIEVPQDGCDPKFRTPNLDQVQRKIFVKVKRLHASLHASGPSSPNPQAPAATATSTATATVATAPLTAPFALQSPPSLASKASAPTPTSSPRLAQLSKFISAPTYSPPQSPLAKISPALMALGIYTRSEHFKNPQSLNTKEAKFPSHIFSVAENQLLDTHRVNERGLFLHNKCFFMRAYPNVIRVDSSNPDPSLFWRRGVQMVAMNWQNMDEGMMLNEAMFAGEDGWVLKPPGYLSSNKTCETADDAEPPRIMDFEVTIFLGLNVAAADTYTPEKTLSSIVKVELHVDKKEGAGGKDRPLPESTYKRQTTSHKTLNPFFGATGETLSFPNVPRVVEPLSFVRFKIESTSGLVGSPILSWACIRLDRLRQGYRFIHLKDMRGDPVHGGRLFVKITKTLK